MNIKREWADLDRPTRACISVVCLLFPFLSSRLSDVLMHHSVNDALEASMFTVGGAFILDALTQSFPNFRQSFNKGHDYMFLAALSGVSVSIVAMREEYQQRIAENVFKENNPLFTPEMLLNHRALHGTYTERDMYSYPIGSLLGIVILYFFVHTKERQYDK